MLALTLPDADYLGTLPVDVAAEPRLALDTLPRARYKGIECAVDLEAEARARPHMGRRCFEYAARATCRRAECSMRVARVNITSNAVRHIRSGNA